MEFGKAKARLTFCRPPPMQARFSYSSVPGGRGAKVVQSRLNALVGRVSSESEFIPCLGFGNEADALIGGPDLLQEGQIVSARPFGRPLDEFVKRRGDRGRTANIPSLVGLPDHDKHFAKHEQPGRVVWVGGRGRRGSDGRPNAGHHWTRANRPLKYLEDRVVIIVGRQKRLDGLGVTAVVGDLCPDGPSVWV